jgi:hypothetical protein
VLAEKGKDTADMTKMLGLGFGVYKDIVKIDDHPFVKDGVKDFEHHVGKGGRGVGKTERDDVKLEVTIPTAEGSLMSMWLVDALLVVPRDQVQLGKVLGATETVYQLVNSG